MNFQQRQELRNELRLTPQLILNLKLLVLPGIELQQLIEEELGQNPALEPADDFESPESTTAQSDAEDLPEEPAVPEGTGTGNPDEEFNISELLSQDGWDLPVPEREDSEDEPLISEVVATPKLTYHDTILPKLLAEVQPEDTRVAEEIVEWLDEDGFLSATPLELSETTGIPLEALIRVLAILVRIPPGGIGCLDVRTGLIAQLELKGYSETSLERRILEEYWTLFIKQEVKQLADKLHAPIDEIERAIVNISVLEPKPGRQFNDLAPEYVVPDFSVEWQDGKFVSVEQDSYIPRIRIARRFIDIIQNPQNYSPEAVAFARKKVNNGIMFLRAIESRRRLLRRIMDWVISRQDDFFRRGIEFLKPAKIKEVAAELGVHQATVSRAISGKYVETQFGIFKLRDFFKSGTGGVARSGIKEKIQAMIEREDKRNPLNDEEICLRLAGEGIKISRRTVAKYRAELGILGSEERRKQ